MKDMKITTKLFMSFILIELLTIVCLFMGYSTASKIITVDNPQNYLQSFGIFSVAEFIVVMIILTVMAVSLTRNIRLSLEEVIDAIPQDASVAASTFLIPHLADRTHIYEVYYTQHTEFDYVVLDMRDSYREDSLARAEQFEDLGYKLTDIGSAYVFVYTK